jgi:hypothetical protein
MADDIENREEEPLAPAAGEGVKSPDADPADSAAGGSSTDLDALLAEYDAGIKAAEPEQPDELEQLLGRLSQQERESATRQQQHDAELLERDGQSALDALARGDVERDRDGWKGAAEQSQAMLNEVVRQVNLARERSDFDAFVRSSQERLPGHMPAGWAERWMTAEGMKNQELADAWDHRHVGEERAKAEIGLAQHFIERELASGAPRLAEIEQAKAWMTKMGAALASKQILADAQRRMVAEAKSIREVDPDISADVAAVQHYMRSASQGKVAAEPQPWLGGLSDREFSDYKKQFGF